MEQNTTYQYAALNDKSYAALAAYAIDIDANVQLFPSQRIINIDGSAAKKVGEFIDANGLSFHINPFEVHDENFGEVIDNKTTDPETLRGIIYRLLEQRKNITDKQESVIAHITKERDTARKDSEMYRRWYHGASNDASRIKRQIGAIAALMGSLYPESRP